MPGNNTEYEFDMTTTMDRVTDLIPGVNYTFQVAAKNSLGTGEYSEKLPVAICAQRADPPRPEQIRVVEKNITSLTFEWDEPTCAVAPRRMLRVSAKSSARNRECAGSLGCMSPAFWMALRQLPRCGAPPARSGCRVESSTRSYAYVRWNNGAPISDYEVHWCAEEFLVEQAGNPARQYYPPNNYECQGVVEENTAAFDIHLPATANGTGFTHQRRYTIAGLRPGYSYALQV